ncbi:hypothetical protein NDU88_004641 [Pleurodeles waltl]|uniref:Uncharacterized protein n=1 Tax=Pleurodeles waltl TaxID=8319 RepID=A0AAV7VKW1_PLEWA|nr:hypothetical protein NDU88_004641 [Pleurodeles waltl]
MAAVAGATYRARAAVLIPELGAPERRGSEGATHGPGDLVPGSGRVEAVAPRAKSLPSHVDGGAAPQGSEGGEEERSGPACCGAGRRLTGLTHRCMGPAGVQPGATGQRWAVRGLGPPLPDSAGEKVARRPRACPLDSGDGLHFGPGVRRWHPPPPGGGSVRAVWTEVRCPSRKQRNRKERAGPACSGDGRQMAGLTCTGTKGPWEDDRAPQDNN